MLRPIAALLLPLALVAACSDGGGSGDGSSAPSPSAGGGSDTTVPADVPQPYGMHYELPGVAVTPSASSLDTDGTRWLAIGTTPSSVSNCAGGSACGRFASNPVAFTGASPDALTPVTIDDIAAVPLPAGWTQRNYLIPNDLAASPQGMVVGGTLSVWDSPGFYAGTTRGMLWFSADGAAWQRIDVTGLLGDVLSSVKAVEATDNGFVAVVQVAGTDPAQGPSRLVTLSSTDGATWVKGAELPTTWAASVWDIRAAGNLVLMEAVEFMCDGEAFNMIDFSVGAQGRFFASVDGGATFNPIDIDTASPTLVAGRPEVPAADACPTDLSTRDTYRWTPSMDAVGGTFAIIDPQGGRVLTSTDLVAWTEAEVAGLLPDDRSTSAQLSVDGGDVVLLQVAGEGADRVLRAWRADSARTTWTVVPDVPLFDDPRGGELVRFTDGTIGLLLVDDSVDPSTVTLLQALPI